MTHRVPASLSWSFFPTSALVYSFGYAGPTILVRPASIRLATLLSNSNRVSNWIGYNGALTERFSLTASVGYAVGFYDLGSDFDGVIARAEARWRPRPTITLSRRL